MTFLDTSTIIQYLRDDSTVREYIEGREPWLTSTVCVFEVLNGRLGSDNTDIGGVRQDFAGVQAIELNESIAIEAARLQDELIDDGERLATVDLLVAATARSTGDELVVADADFQTDALEDAMQVTNLRT
ncbi:PIN domain-containing protein [Halosimplex salinum]|uniref:PIN domain-containing protein n=1 Tax=Halosimplex salinum TaxID=1710538 RepID=UPI000F48EDB6|nr:PIN domain-containing protein [Halosimplex salinum]